jgi:hypothetical protein
MGQCKKCSTNIINRDQQWHCCCIVDCLLQVGTKWLAS